MWKSRWIVTVVLLAMPAMASAQSAISGLVTDSTGGVLPGVTVEARSPVLIEGVRTAVTNGQGRYNITNLRPGVYDVTFSLTGFSTVRREAVSVPTDVTVTVSAQLQVGSLEETITVSGASPVVDVRQSATTQNLNQELLDTLPSQRTLFGSAGTIPGVRLTTPDVGGQRMMQHSAGALEVHGLGGGDNAIQIDGLIVNSQQSDGSVMMYFNDSMTDEVSYQTSSTSAEVSHGGLRQNMIPKQGGNTFSGSSYLSGVPGSWINNDIPADLAARGLTFPSSIDRMYDYNVGLGGPILRDKFWFYASYQERSVNEIVAGTFDKAGKPGVEDQWIRNPSVRLTYQATPKNKLTAYYDRALKHKGTDGSFGDEWPEATTQRPWDHGLYYVGQGKWTSTLTNIMLLEVGHSQVFEDHTITCQDGINKSRGTPEWYAGASRVDRNLGTRTLSCSGGHHPEYPRRYSESGALSYVTGSHAIKVGMQWSWGIEKQGRYVNADLEQRYRNGVPDDVRIFNSPVENIVSVPADRGIYAQDSWTMNRLTLNYGVRFEHFKSRLPEYTRPEGRFIPATHFPEYVMPIWNDVAPRFGLVYDLFGDGKTALKFGANKYMRQWASGFARRYSPTDYNATDVRNWVDLNGDDIAQDEEIGPSNNKNFGIAVTRRPADDIQREYTVEYMASVQREVIEGASLSFGWYRRLWYDLEKADNLLVEPGDYHAIPTANPLGNGETITLYNLDKSKQGLVDILDTTSGLDGRTYDGFEVSGNARFPNGAAVFGGWSTERTVETLCDVDNLNQLRFCDQSGKLHQELGRNASMPFRWDAKLSGTYPIPAPVDVQLSMSYQSVAGDMLAVNWNVPTSAFKPETRTESVVVNLISPGTKYLERRNQIDVGIRRPFRIGGLTAIAGFDIFNALNDKAVLSQNQSFGSALDNAQSTLLGRMFRVSANMKW